MRRPTTLRAIRPSDSVRMTSRPRREMRVPAELQLQMKQSNTKLPVADYMALRQYAARRRMTLQELMASLLGPAAAAIRRGECPLETAT